MNEDILKGKWAQVKGHVKSWWGRMTDDDIEQIDGKFESLVGKVQERYGHTREAAEKECKEKCELK